MNSLLLAGVGRTDITPPLGTALAGYPVQDRYAETIRDPLHATALVLERGACRVAIISSVLHCVKLACHPGRIFWGQQILPG